MEDSELIRKNGLILKAETHLRNLNKLKEIRERKAR